jgi:hypothetical protein
MARNTALEPERLMPLGAVAMTCAGAAGQHVHPAYQGYLNGGEPSGRWRS